MTDRRRRPEGSWSLLHLLLRWTYARWVQVLAHLDLLGRDGRPSQSKVAACAVLTVGLFIALFQTVHVEKGAGQVGAATVTIIIAGLSASFGIRTFTHFLEQAQFQQVSEQRDVHIRVEAEPDARKDDERGEYQERQELEP